ncbi:MULTISPECIES: hypothetical protein [unclassified Pseudoxanthomonas]|uniref:hypothetical protein n=1 Tax=unclassified Pseudoxanthomonas TaxID=2645906 RepID=UPI003078181D
MRRAELKEYLRSGEALREAQRTEPVMRGLKGIDTRVFPLLVVQPNKPFEDQIGSCVLFHSQGRTFLLTAAHVIDELLHYPEDAELHLYADREVFTLTRNKVQKVSDFIENGEHVAIDAAVIEISQPVPKHLEERSFQECDVGDPDDEDMHIIAGYPHSMVEQRDIGGSTPATLYALLMVPTIFYGFQLYDGIRVGVRVQDTPIDGVSLAFVNHGVHVDQGRYVQHKALQGISGGAVLRLKGLPHNTCEPSGEKVEILLTSIVVEQRKRKYQHPPLVIGTSIRLYLALIKGYIALHDSVSCPCSWRAVQLESRPFSAGQ